jgi:hypothetical protein
VGKAKITAVLTVRNEGTFLLEWLAHHRAVGITDFLVFSNDCQDGTERMLDRLKEMGWLAHLPNPGLHRGGPQWTALKRASRRLLVTDAEWLITCDIDEFINVKVGDRDIHTCCARAAVLALAGMMIKTLCRNDGTYRRLGVHRPRRPDLERMPAHSRRSIGGPNALPA